MARHPPAWYDAQYHTRAAIPEHPAILREWSERSAAARAALTMQGDLAYGDGPGETLDLFPAARPGAPLLIYIHGGYWRALDKRDQSFVAPPFVAAGAAVILPNHALAPAVSVEHIVRQLLRMFVWVWRRADVLGVDRRRIVVAGHSAGGHLAAMLLACRWRQLAPDLPARPLRGALAISGLYDLEPLRHAPFLAPDLRLTAAGARRMSPVHIAAPSAPLFTFVGGDESAAFHRQQRAIRRAWGPAAVPVCETVPGRHHMDVLHELAEPRSPVFRRGAGLLGL
jgi:arylformamidase